MSEHDSQPSSPSAERWITDIHASRQVDIAVSSDFDPINSLLTSQVEGIPLQEQLAAEHGGDEGVKAKNKFLSLLAAAADDGRFHVGDLLALMDNQAEGMSPSSETRYRQFMGLWDLAVALSRDEELLEQLREQH
ncbi:MAG: hypothetical protein ACHQT9_03670 [Candidatus Saccharimonadales bacterium]